MATLNTAISNITITTSHSSRKTPRRTASPTSAPPATRRLQPHDHLQRTGVFEDTRDYSVHGQAGNDTISTAAGDDVVYGGSGADTISTGMGQDELFGGSGADKLYAGSGDDALDGGSGNDVMDGGSGTDYLFGGTGNDTMTGGSDRDFFTVTLTSGTDLITDFARGQDKIVLGWDIRQYLPDTYQGAYDVAAALVNLNVPGLEPAANTTAPTLIFNALEQVLSFDADGLAGSGAAVDLVKLTGVTQLSGSDFWATRAVLRRTPTSASDLQSTAPGFKTGSEFS